jgi:galactokinase
MYDADFQQQLEMDRLRKAAYEAMQETQASKYEPTISQRLSILETDVKRILEVIEKLANTDAIKALVNCKKPKTE